MNRREFTQLAALMPFAGLFPELALADNTTAQDKRILVMVELAGGNDGLNTLIPLNQFAKYKKVRPTLALKKAIEISDGVGMNVALEKLHPHWKEGDMGWIQNVGYPTPDRSHFRSKDIWETASSSDQQRTDGWLSLALPNKKKGLHGVVVGSGLGPMAGKNCRAVAMHDPRTFVNQAKLVEEVNYTSSNPSLAHVLDVQHQLHGAKELLTKSAKVRHMDQYFRHRSNFNNDLKSVAQMIVGGADVMVYKVTLPGFDTHMGQAVAHKNLLTYLADGLDSFSKAMKGANMWDNVLVMTYSEFGRSITENLSHGTDHGTAAPQLVMGGNVKGGKLYGETANLDNTDKEGDLNYSTDFRAIYASIAKNWWGEENPWRQHAPIEFI